jgi:hypothetical protein
VEEGYQRQLTQLKRDQEQLEEQMRQQVGGREGEWVCERERVVVVVERV